MSEYTADICDANEENVRVAEPIFQGFGGVERFSGPARTLRVFEDNSFVKQAVTSPGDGAVLVVDGGGSTRCALLGGNLAVAAAENGWAGVIIHGCIRDQHEVGECDIGVHAIASCPKRSEKRGEGEGGVVVNFAGIEIAPGDMIYADRDGVVVVPAA